MSRRPRKQPDVLAYAQQVLELEKIARLEARRPASDRALPPLASTSSRAGCVVCGELCALSCEGCRVIHYCGPPHQRLDAPFHAVVCEALRESEEDARLLQATRLSTLAERLMAERAAPASPATREVPGSFDEYLAPRAARDEHHRIFTDLASRPLTLAYLLHELRLLEAPRQEPLRVHVAAASSKELESLLLYQDLVRFWPDIQFDVAFFGPELPLVSAKSSHRVRFAFCAAPYGLEHWARFGPPDLVVAFDAGLLLYRSWQRTLIELIGSGAPFAVTSYRAWEAQAEAKVLLALGATPLREPKPNPFSSLVSRRSSTLANDVSHDNAYVSVWR